MGKRDQRDPDIQLLFGVFGGDGFGTGSSGALIQEQLTNIVKKINEKPFEIKFQAETSSLKSITEQIQKSIGNVTVNTGVDGGGTKAAVAALQPLSKNVIALNNALSKLESIRHTIESSRDTLIKTQDSDTVRGFSQDVEVLSTKLEYLKRSVNSGMTGLEFAKSYSTISLMTKEISNNIKEYTADLKAASTAKTIPLIGDDQTSLNAALSKIETLRHSLAAGSRAIAELGENAEAKGYVVNSYAHQIENLTTRLNELKNGAAGKTKNDFDRELSDIALHAKEAANGISEYAASLKKGKTDEASFKVINQDVTALNNALSKLETIRHNLAASKTSLSTMPESEAVKEYSTEIEVLDEELKRLQNELLNTEKTGDAFAKEYSAIALMTKQLKDNIQEYNAELKASSASVTVALLGDDPTALNNALAKIETLRHSLAGGSSILSGLSETDKVVEYKTTIDGLTRSLSELGDAASGKTKQEFDEELSAIALDAKKATNGINEYTKTLKASSEAEAEAATKAEMLRAAEQNVAQALKTITDARSKYAAVSVKVGSRSEMAALDAYEKELEDLVAKLKSGSISQEEFNQSLVGIRGNVSEAVRSLAAYEAQTVSLKDRISSVTKEIVGFYSARMLIMRGISTVKDMVNNAVELESAFADTRIVTHATTEELKSFGVTITAIANDTAASIQDLVSATTTFARLGFSLDDSTVLAKFTGMLEKVGNVDTQRAEDAVTSIIKAFPDEVNIATIEDAMDRLVKTGNNFPISVDQIAEGMTNASSALAAAGNSFEQSVALLTAANTTVQNASKASTALRTISARLRKTTTDIDDGEAITEAKYQELIRILSNHRVSLLDVNNEFKSTYEILESIANVWSDMTSLEQSAVAEAISGTRQQVVFYSIIDHFQEASDAMEAMSNSAGSLEQSYDIYLNTAAAHIERLGIAWKTFSMDAVNSNFIKTVVDIGTGLLNVVDALQRMHLLIPTIITGVAAFKALKMSSELNKSAQAVDFVVSALVKESTISKSLEAQFMSLTAVQQQNAISQLRLAATAGDVGAAEAIMSLELNGLISAEAGATVATRTLADSFKALFASNPMLWIAGAVTAIIAIISYTRDLKEEIRGIEEINTELESIADNVTQTADSFRRLRDEASDVIPRFVELADGVDRFGRKTASMTDEDYAEFVGLTNKVAELFPELSNGMDDTGVAMLNLNLKAKDLSETLWDIVEARREMALLETAGQMDTAFQDAYESNKIYQDQEEKIKSAVLALKEFKREFKYDEYFDSNAISQLLPVAGFESLADAFDVIREVSPEFNNILDRLEGVDSAGLYYILGDGYDIESFYKDIDNVITHTQSRLRSAGLQTENNIAWNYVKQSAIAWAQSQSDYQEAEGAVQDIITSMIGNIDLVKLNLKTSDDLRTYIYDTILDPILSMSNEGKRAISKYLDMNASFANGEITVDGMTSAIISLNEALVKSGIDAEDVMRVLDTLGATDVGERIDSVRHSITGETEAVKEFVDALSDTDLNIVYNIVSEEGSMTLDEIVQRLEEAKTAALDTQNAIEEITLDEFLKDLSDSTSKIDSITSAMQKLQKGTSLTITELVKLAQQFPELLSQSDLFTDGSIEGQRRMLQFMLEANKKEYESKIDTKVAQLNVEIEAAKAQLEVEKQKQALRASILKKSIDGQISVNDAYIKDVIELNKLESTSYASLQEGKVVVNADAMNTISKNTNDVLRDSVDYQWNPYGQAIVETYTKAVAGALDAESDLFAGVAQMMEALGYETAYKRYHDPNTSEYEKRAMEASGLPFIGLDLSTGTLGDKMQQIYDVYNRYNDRSIGYSGTQYSGSVKELTAGYASVQSWYDNASKQAEEQIALWESAIKGLELERDNIDALRNALTNAIDQSALDETVKDVTKSIASSGSSSSSNPRYQDFIQWYKDRNHEFTMIDAGVDPQTLKYIEGDRYVVPSKEEYVYEMARRIKNLIANGDIDQSDAYKYLEEIQKIIQSFSDNAQKAIDDLVSYRSKAIKDAMNKEKEALNDRLSALKDFYSKQKDMLKDAREEEKYLDEQAEKRTAISDIKSQLDMLQYDTSAWARKKTAELQKNLEEAEKALSDFEKDHAVDTATATLDAEYEKQEAEIQSAITKIDESLNDPNSIYNEALADINSNSKEILEELKAYGEAVSENGVNEAEKLIKNLTETVETYERYISLRDNTQYQGGYNGVYSPLGIGYASGTRSAIAGLHRVNEYGAETLFVSANGNKYRMFSGGEKVLDVNASNFLYDFATTMGRGLSGSIASGAALPTSMVPNNINAGVIKTGDIIINGDATERTVSEIRRAQREQLNSLLKEMNRLK